MAEENKVESGVVLPPADFTGQLQKEAQEMGVALNEHQIKQFYDYYELLIHWNTMSESDSDHGTEGSCDQTFFG
ncbi:MAG: hypothetical protein ACLR8P_04095 [Clostridium fessum]